MPPLQIYDRRERAIVTAADGVLTAAGWLARPFRRRAKPSAPRRILLLRLERIGDLIMALPAIADIRAALPDAAIDLAVGRWNAELAGAIPAIGRVHVVDAAWLARDGGGLGLGRLAGAAREWRRHEYDLAINFEPDVRTNLLLAASGARWTAGYRSGGGGALLDTALDYDTRSHTTDNARRLVTAVVGGTATPAGRPLLSIPAMETAEAAHRLPQRESPAIAIHVSGGRAIKQWPPDRFAAVAVRLLEETDATIVLTGSAADRPLVNGVLRVLAPGRAIDAAGDTSLLSTAALLERCDLLITGDTGPMHLAAAVGTPIVAVFGPSDPVRYAPRGEHDRIVRVDLPCAPCNRIRLPPERCTGHTPDCLSNVSVDMVLRAARAVLASVRPGAMPASRGVRQR